MSIIAAAALVALSKAPCEWDAPGHDPYMGEVPSAIEHYTDIPADVRARLRARMERRAYDDLVIIRRDEIVGDFDLYSPTITGMHFGSKGRICPAVTRNNWSDELSEFALVYCEDTTCIMVPTVCRNVARITRYRMPKLPPLAPVPLRLENPPYAPLGPLPGLPEGPILPQPTPDSPPQFYWPVYPFPIIYVPPIRPTPVPEPATWALLGAGLALLATRCKK